MDSNSTTYLLLFGAVALFVVLFFFFVGFSKRKPKARVSSEQSTRDIPAFRLKSTKAQVLLVLLWVPILTFLPILLLRPDSLIVTTGKDFFTSFVVTVFVLSLIFLSWLNSAQDFFSSSKDKGTDENH